MGGLMHVRLSGVYNSAHVTEFAFISVGATSMNTAQLQSIHQMAITQGRPTTPLKVSMEFFRATNNWRPRKANHLRATKVCYHKTHTGRNVSAPDLCFRHRTSANTVSSWNEIIDWDGTCYRFVDVTTQIANAQGVSAVEAIGWDSDECAQGFRSLEVVGFVNENPAPRELELPIIQYMWWLNDQGYALEKWKEIYDTHARIARPRGRRSDPGNYDPFNLALRALGTIPGPGPTPVPRPMTGTWKVNVTTRHANVRVQPSLSSPIIDEIKNGVEVRIVEWKNGDFVGGSDWWGRRAQGGWMSLAVILPIARDNKPPIGTWFVTTTARSVNIRAEKSTESKSLGSILNGKPVEILDWLPGEAVEGVTWWGVRKGGGFVSKAVLTQAAVVKPASIVDTVVRRGAVLTAQLTPKMFLPTYGPGDLVTCGHDVGSPDRGRALLTMEEELFGPDEIELAMQPIEGISG